MFPRFNYPIIENPTKSDINKAIQLVGQMADIALMASMSAAAYDRPGVIFDTIEQSLRFASSVLEKGLLEVAPEKTAQDKK